MTAWATACAKHDFAREAKIVLVRTFPFVSMLGCNGGIRGHDGRWTLSASKTSPLHVAARPSCGLHVDHRQGRCVAEVFPDSVPA